MGRRVSSSVNRRATYLVHAAAVSMVNQLPLNARPLLPMSRDMNLLLIVLLVLMIPALVTYLRTERD